MSTYFSETLFLFSFCIFFGSSCNPNDKAEIERTASAFDIEQGRASILQGNQNFMKAFNSIDSTGVADIFSKDAKLMTGHVPAILGRDKIKSYISSIMSKGLKDFELTTLNLWGDSSILAEEGTYTLSDSTGSQIDRVKYIVL